MTVTERLPRWDMAVIFPGLDSQEFRSEFEAIQRGLDHLEKRFDELGVHKDGRAEIVDFDEAMHAYNSLSERMRTLNAYIHAFTSTDSRDELASARDSEIDNEFVRMRKLSKQLQAWIGGLELEKLLAISEIARAHEYWLIKTKIAAQHQMHPGEESLAADLEVTGMSAWVKLYGNMTSQLSVPITLHGKAESLPMSVVRTLACDPDREVRRTAFEAELHAWKSVEVPIAAALNSVKGELGMLCRKRRWDDPLDEAVFGANIDRATLDAMMMAARESFPDFRRYMNAKAQVLGIPKLAFYDLFAPVGDEDDEKWTYDRACTFVADQFRGYSDKLADYALRNFREDWVDAGPRPGKVDGAYCMGIRRDESRILMNFKPAFGSVSTLAHELGHGYHNLCLNGRTATQRATPMTLAETASIFCETIIRQAVLANGTPSEQFSVLEQSLQGSCQVVVDISSRFLFEQSVLDGRKKRELSPREMCDLMRAAQLQTYGDGLDAEGLHPYMWAAKSHYYGRSYYNFPYMFGLLFGLGLYAVYERDPESFKDRYDDLLSSTGIADAATLGRRFGIDITTPDFWRASLDQIRADIDRFEALVKAR